MLGPQAINDGLHHRPVGISQSLQVGCELGVGFFDFEQFCILLAGDKEFVLHEDFPDVGGGILLEGQQHFVYLVLSLKQLRSHLLRAIAPRPGLALQKAYVKGEEKVPVLTRLAGVHSHLGTLFQDAEELELVLVQLDSKLLVLLPAHLLVII